MRGELAKVHMLLLGDGKKLVPRLAVVNVTEDARRAAIDAVCRQSGSSTRCDAGEGPNICSCLDCPKC